MKKRRTKLRKRSLRWRLVAWGAAGVAALFVWAALMRHFAPAANTGLHRFDTIIVLGTPADRNGNPTPTQLARVSEAVHEYERGVAPRLIMTGGANRQGFDEARVMARTAEAQGVPASAIFIEPHATDTIQNACYSARIMKGHGWHSAEVVSTPGQLPLAGLIFSRMPIEWRTHAAPLLEPESNFEADQTAGLETLKTVYYLVWTNWAKRCQP
jgi:uncharacterized SAM-binding protein YcdF (DUF218 family)